MDVTRREFLMLTGTGIVWSLLPQKTFAGVLSIPVLMYHDISNHFKDDYTVSPAAFSAQMEWLYCSGYRTLFFSDLDTLDEDRNRKSVIITFDDGYASFSDYVFPVLREYGFRATVNIIGKHAGTYINMGGNRPLLSWDEYRYLHKSGLVDLGCHTYNLHFWGKAHSHDEKEIETDLLLFQEIFGRELGRNTEVLAWPFGIYSKRTMAIARKAGFRYIMTSNEGYLKRGGNLEEIPRLNINDKLDMVSFQQYIGEKK